MTHARDHDLDAYLAHLERENDLLRGLVALLEADASAGYNRGRIRNAVVPVDEEATVRVHVADVAAAVARARAEGRIGPPGPPRSIFEGRL